MAHPRALTPTPPPDGDQRIGFRVIACHATLLAIATILLFLRLFTRSVIVKSLGLDDLFIFIGLLFSVSSFTVDIFMIRDGIGRHIFQLLQNQHTLEELSEATKLQYINEVLLILGVMFVRVSICFLLIRIFGLATKKQWRWTIYSILVFNVLTSISCVIIVLAQCRPLTKLWNPLIHGSCWGPKTVNAIGDYNGAVSVFSDWTLATLPIVFMWKIQMSVKVKTGICVLLGMGFFSGVATIVRTSLLKDIASSDLTWDIIALDIWATLELHVGIIAACIPTLKPLFSPSTRYPWIKKGWRCRLAHDSVQPHAEDEHHLHDFALRKTLPIVPPGLHTRPGNSERNHVTVLGGSTRHGLRLESSESGDSRDGIGGAEEGITKKSEFSLETRGDDEATYWSREIRGRDGQEAFDQV